MMGRATIHLSPADFMAVLRGAGKLYVLVQKVQPPITITTTDGTFTYAFENIMRTFATPDYEPIDLFGLRMVHVEYDPTCDMVEVSLSGPGLPNWEPGNFPEVIPCKVDITALDAPQEPPPSRRFDLSDE